MDSTLSHRFSLCATAYEHSTKGVASSGAREQLATLEHRSHRESTQSAYCVESAVLT